MGILPNGITLMERVRMEEDKSLLQMHYSNASEDPLDSTTVNLNSRNRKPRTLHIKSVQRYCYSGGQSEHTETLKRKVKVFRDNCPFELRASVHTRTNWESLRSVSLTKEDGTESCLMDVPL